MLDTASTVLFRDSVVDIRLKAEYSVRESARQVEKN
jgi:hypothetical protein